MRSGRLNKDGVMELSVDIAKYSKDRDRYDRFRAGETVADICVADGIAPDKAIKSIRQGRMTVEAEQMLELRDLNHSTAVAVARLRAKARMRSEVLVLDGLEELLKGRRTVSSVLKETGEIITQDITDPEVISMGLEHARKIMSIDERPAQNQTIVNFQSNQQNNYGETPAGPTAQTYEERLKRIRNRQLGAGQPDPDASEVIEAEVIHSETTPAADPPSEQEQKDWESF